MALACDLVIERMRLEHLPAVAEIEQLSFQAPWPVEAYRHEIEVNPNAAYFVARLRLDDAPPASWRRRWHGHEVVGYAGTWVRNDSAHVSTIAVHPGLRRRRIGERLLLRLIDLALSRGVTLVTLEVRATNTAARRLYNKYGLVQTGFRQGYYSDNGEDALLFSTPPLDDPAWRGLLEQRRRAVSG